MAEAMPFLVFHHQHSVLRLPRYPPELALASPKMIAALVVFVFARLVLASAIPELVIVWPALGAARLALVFALQ